MRHNLETCQCGICHLRRTEPGWPSCKTKRRVLTREELDALEEDETRDRCLHPVWTRMPHLEHELVRYHAAEEGLSRAEWIRAAVVEKLEALKENTHVRGQRQDA